MTVSALMMSAPAFAQLEVPQKWDAEYDIVIVAVFYRLQEPKNKKNKA